MSWSWLPTPDVLWPNYSTGYSDIVSQAYDSFPLDETGELYKDLVTIGEIFSKIRELQAWIMKTAFVTDDTAGMFLHLSEEDFNISSETTTDERIYAITSAYRLFGKTSTPEWIQGVFAPVYGVESEEVLIDYASVEEIIAQDPESDIQWRSCMFQYFLYCPTETKINRQLGESLIQKYKQVGYIVYMGEDGPWLFTTGEGYDRSTYVD